MEGDLLRFHSSLQNVHFVPSQHDWDVLANTNDVTVPVGNIFVSGPRGHVEHDDGAIPLNADTAKKKL